MSPRNDREPAAELRDALGPGILPRQLRILERLAVRLDAERPEPSSGFRADLAASIGRLDDGADSGVLSGWRLRAWACLGSGVGLLLLAAILAL